MATYLIDGCGCCGSISSSGSPSKLSSSLLSSLSSPSSKPSSPSSGSSLSLFPQICADLLASSSSSPRSSPSSLRSSSLSLSSISRSPSSFSPGATGCCDVSGLTLHGTFSNGPTCLNGQTLTFTPSMVQSYYWQSSSFTYCTMTGSNAFYLRCDPSGAGWTLSLVTSGCFTITSSLGPISVICSPLQIVFGPGIDSTCGGPGVCTLTITT